MDLTWFESAVVAADVNGNIVFAMFDGPTSDRMQEGRLVTMLICKAETADALRKAIAAALKEEKD